MNFLEKYLIFEDKTEEDIFYGGIRKLNENYAELIIPVLKKFIKHKNLELRNFSENFLLIFQRQFIFKT